MLFFVFACFFPRYVMMVFTNDPVLIQGGVEYLRILGVSYLFMGVSQGYLRINAGVLKGSYFPCGPLVRL